MSSAPGPWTKYAAPQESQPSGPWNKYVAPSPYPADTPDAAKPFSDADAARFTVDPAKAWKAGVHSNMLGVPPSFAYQNADEIDKQLRSIDPGYDNDSLKGAIETGFEETPLGMLIRGKAPDPFESNNALLRFVHNAVSFAGDPVVLAPTIIGAVADLAVPGAAAVGFVGGSALDAGLREAMMEHYQKGDVKSFKELTDRAGDVLWSATKGALSAEAFTAAGEILVPGAIADNALASTAVKGLYQASAITAAGALLDGRVPRLQDFEDSALMIVPLNLATGGLLLRGADAKQALMDVYAKDGTTPEQSQDKLTAQPAVPEDQAPGLRPAINFNGSIAEADEGETHPDIAKRATGTAPVDLDQLNADPELADRVLQNPTPHLQDVIDRAVALKQEALDRGVGEKDETIDQYRNLKSGRGFVTPDGKFLDRNAARRWVKENEPAVHEMWGRIAGDEKAEFHADDYGQARFRVAGRDVASGEPGLNGASPQLTQFLSRSRTELNAIKADQEASRYGKSVLRTLLSGPKNMLRAQAEQIVSRMRKLIPDYRDQEALSFLRDYRDDPSQLRATIEEIRSGTNEKLKAFIPSMERALDPSPEMMQADRQLTQYFTQALGLGRQVGVLESSIDPARYSPRLFMKVTEDAEQARGVGRPKFTEKTPHSIQRQYLRVLDPLKSGDFEARTFNALDELSVYADRHSTAIATKLFTTELKNSEMGKWGSRETMPEGWTQLAPDQRGFHQTMSKIDPETGDVQTWSRGLFVPKAVADAMKPMLESGGLPSQVLSALHVQSFVKAIELSLSIFHMKALTITAMNNMSFGDFTRALKSDNSSATFEAGEREGALHGLETTKTQTPYEAYRGLKPSSLPTGLDKLADLPVLKQVDAFAQSLTRETFDVIQRKFKVMDYAQKSAAWIAKHSDASDAEYGSAMRGIAKEVNAAYGGLNWDVLGVGKGMRDLSRLLILAPDWTFSNVANLKYVGEGGPAGSAARAFWVKSFATGIAMSQAVSVLVSGQTKMDHPTSVYLGKDKVGKEMYSNMFFAGAPKDAITLVNRVMKDGLLSGFVGFMANKFGPVAGTLLGIAENKAWGGKPITKRTDSPIEKDVKNVGFAAQQMLPVPFGLKDIGQMLMDPKAQNSRWDYVLPLLGTYVTHEGTNAGSAPSEKQSFRLPGVSRGTKGMRLPGQRGAR